MISTIFDVNDIQSEYFVLKYSASWCGPCKIIKEYFESLSKDELFSNIQFYETDINDINDSLLELGVIKYLPTFLFGIKDLETNNINIKSNVIGINKEEIKNNLINLNEYIQT